MKGRIVAQEAFEDLIREIAAERPDFIYLRGRTGEDGDHAPGYLYGLSKDKHGIESRCIIGEGLYRLGWDASKSNAFADSVLLLLGFSANTASWALKVQTRQDSGMPWGEAVNI